MSDIAYMFRQGVPDDSLILHVPWGDVDYSRFGHTLTRSGKVVIGHHQQYDGTDDKIDCGDIGNIQQVSMWIKPGSDTEEILLVDTGNDIMVDSGVVTYAGLSAVATYVNGVATTALAADFWQHLVCQFTQIDANNFELGTDGANFGEIELCDVRARDALWTADKVMYEYKATRIYF